ncbi:MAG: hypothetical protein AVDCRST_MAG50-2664 [uncultured Acidimicrobiales bacterium]|uniref:AI-2E family transporter n=1 Tax=uncultured Acidimicrobiales bacterium TaxID=310071 RepID=A0A6J4IN14_9ACTN|nr:MAG: hypothetical protein AVDCRST_MAG50-2664 [uncultured Acidimicrobiales bacterium]
MTERLRRAGQVAWALVGVAVLLAVLGLLAWAFRVIFPPLILAAAIVFILNPVVTRLQHRGLPRAVAAGLAYVAVLTVLVVAAVLIFPLAAGQVDQLAADAPEIESKVETFIADIAATSQGTFFEFSEQDVEQAVSREETTFEEQVAQLRRIGAEIFHALLVLVLAPIIAFYLLVDVPHLRKVAESLIPAGARHEVLVVSHRLNRAIGGFFRGQLLVALLVGVMCSLGLAAIGLEFWFLIGMIAGLFNVIPLVGPWIGGIPGVTIALTTGTPLQALLVVVVMVAVQQIDNHFITPQVMQRIVHLHPAAVILGLLAGGSMGGFLGLMLAVPAAAALKIVIGDVWRVHILGEPIDPLGEVDMGAGIVEDVADRQENQGLGGDDASRPDEADAGAAASALDRPTS